MIDQLAVAGKRLFFLCLGAMLLPALASAQSPAPPVRAQVIAESTSIHPGSPFLVAVNFHIQPGWHIYWKNPGDTGLPTTVQWDLPKGFSAHDLQWPVPRKFVSQGLASYGYEGEVSLLAQIDPPADLAPGNVPIRAHAGWLACRIECTPGKADLSAFLPVEPGVPAMDGRRAAFFRAARSLMPAPAPGASFSAQSGRGRILLQVDGLSVPSGATAYFAPLDTGLLAEGAPQSPQVGATSVSIDMQLAKGADAPRVHGVLVVQDKSGARGIDVDTPVAGAAAASTQPASPGMQGLLIALALAFVGGLILNLMPCVLPVISLKVLSFVRTSSEGGGSALRHGLLFAAGVLVSFWAIAGLLVALRAGGQLIGWGFQFQSPAVVTITAAVFFLIALNLLDVFELRLPIRMARPVSPGGGTGSFLSGLLATAVATPCTAPFMGGALGYALTQPPAVGFGVFTALALGLAAPYVVLSAVPGLVKRVPKPGAWMVTLRQVLAFPMLGAVIWMLYVLETQAGFPALLVLLCSLLLAGLGAWIYGRWGGLDKSFRSRVTAAAFSFILVVGTTAFAAVRSSATPDPTAVAPAPSSWESWTPQRLAELQAAGTPVFVDFTARWCLTCQVNEKVALQNPAVQQAFRAAGVATMRADWTDRSDAIARVLASYGRAGVPVYALYSKGSTEPVLLPELLTPAVVLEALKRLP